MTNAVKYHDFDFTIWKTWKIEVIEKRIRKMTAAETVGVYR
jgi:hypothetical protein